MYHNAKSVRCGAEWVNKLCQPGFDTENFFPIPGTSRLFNRYYRTELESRELKRKIKTVRFWRVSNADLFKASKVIGIKKSPINDYRVNRVRRIRARARLERNFLSEAIGRESSYSFTSCVMPSLSNIIPEVITSVGRSLGGVGW